MNKICIQLKNRKLCKYHLETMSARSLLATKIQQQSRSPRYKNTFTVVFNMLNNNIQWQADGYTD